MFSTCIRCRSDLGSNHSISHLPIGRRVAYELTHGRLWVVCPRCGAWNLTPIEDRWEALEECERLFQTAPARSSTTTIGLAEITDHLELVRIGSGATRSDIANCRYGEQMHRRRRWLLYGAAILTGLGIAALTRIHVTVEFPLVAAWILAILAVWVVTIRDVIARKALGLRLRTTNWDRLSLGELPQIRLRRTGDRGHVGLVLGTRKGAPMLSGTKAAALLAAVLPTLNWKSGSSEDIQAAIHLVGQAEGPPLADEAGLATWERILRGTKRITLTDLPIPKRLALEMAVEEARELEALQGRAIRLQPASKIAEEIAAIADDLLQPEVVRSWLTRFKLRKGEPPDSAV